MKKITFNKRNIDGTLEKAEGYAFESDGLKFAISRSGVGYWKVTELSSGAVFLCGVKNGSRKTAIKDTKARIEKYGITDCKRRIANCINKHSKTGDAN